MALNAFQFTGGGNVIVPPLSQGPLAVQVSGPTLVLTNIGTVTVFGSLGGSASTNFNPTVSLSGQTGASPIPGGNTGISVAGIAVSPNQQVVLTSGANSWLWLATQSQQGSINVANGT